MIDVEVDARKVLIRRLLVLLAFKHLITPEKCSGCHIWTGGIESSLVDYRGQRICYWCLVNWQGREIRAGHRLSFTDYRGELEDKREGAKVRIHPAPDRTDKT